MGRDGKQPEPQSSFESWKLRLQKDCEREDKSLAFDALGDTVLRLLWEQGLGPSVSGILESTSQHTRRAHQRGEVGRGRDRAAWRSGS
jgi:hypothetical protein